MTVLNRVNWARLKETALRFSQLGTIIGLAATFGIWTWAPAGSSSDSKRWNTGGQAREADLFKIYSNLSEMYSGEQVTLAGANDWGEQTPDSDWSRPDISVYSFPNDPPSQPPPASQEPADRVQVRAIASLSAVPPWDKPKIAPSDADQPAEKDPFLFQRILVASVAKGTTWAAGDRMVWLRTFVRPVNFKFAAYTVASTDGEAVKISSVETTDTRKLSADVPLPIPGSKITPGRESSVKTTSDISSPYEPLLVDIMPMSLRVIRESPPRGDVLGNTRIALSMTTDPDLIKTAADRDGAEEQPDIALVVKEIHETNDSQELSIKVLPLVPLPHCALRAEVWSIYERRQVNAGNEYYDESRQEVTFLHDVIRKRTVEVVGADDVSPYVWEIQLVPMNEKPESRRDRHPPLLTAMLGDGSPRTLIFSDYARAANLAHWVRTHPGKRLSQYQTNYDDEAARAGMGLAVVKHTQDDCKNNGTPRPDQFWRPDNRSGTPDRSVHQPSNAATFTQAATAVWIF